MPRTILVKVNKDDIDIAFTSIVVGGASLANSCPIARALTRKTGGAAATIERIDASYIDPLTGSTMYAIMTEGARAFIKRFDLAVERNDANLLPHPRTFRLTFF